MTSLMREEKYAAGRKVLGAAGDLERRVASAIRLHVLHSGYVPAEEWARKWLSGADRTQSSAQDLVDKIWFAPINDLVKRVVIAIAAAANHLVLGSGRSASDHLEEIEGWLENAEEWSIPEKK